MTQLEVEYYDIWSKLTDNEKSSVYVNIFDVSNKSVLHYAILFRELELTMSLIRNHPYLITYADFANVCKMNLPFVAHAILDHSSPSELLSNTPYFITDNIHTPLLEACKNRMATLALRLIDSGYSCPEYITEDGDTALIWACYNRLSEVALALIETGYSRPGQINNDGETALIYACRYNLPDVAMALINTKDSIPFHINKYDKTALYWACHNNLYTVAFSLIKIARPSNYYTYINREHEYLDDDTPDESPNDINALIAEFQNIHF